MQAGAGVRPRATVITDASFCHKTKAAGWAAWIVINQPDGTVDRIQKSGTFHTDPSNSAEAERYACFNGLWYAYKLGAREILVQTDCMAVVTGGRRALYSAEAREHWPNATVSWRHVRGHTSGADRRSWVNNWCDENAKKHMRKVRRERQRSSKSNRRRNTGR